MILLLTLFSPLGCRGPGGADTATGSGDLGHAAIIATVATDYSVGALAAVNLDTLAVSDDLSAVSSDPTVSVTAGQVVQMNRGAENNVRLYAPGAYAAPELEFSTGDGSNPHDAEICGGALFVSLYGETYVGVYDPGTGTLLGKVDLSAYNDGDGLPEAGSMVLIGETLYLALEQLDENSSYWTSEFGTIVAIDCDSRAIIGDWTVGPSPALIADPSAPDTPLIRTGVYYDAEGNLNWDGGLWRFDPATGETTSLGMDEADLQANLGSVAVSPSGEAVVLSTDSSWLYTITCLDLSTGDAADGGTAQTYLAGVAVDGQGRAWISARSSWAAPDVPGGILLYDTATCAPLAADRGVALHLEPYAIAFTGE